MVRGVVKPLQDQCMAAGSGDVLNSYYRAQLLGFLYKQG